MFLSLAQLTVFLGFIIYLVKRFGVLPSISDSTYAFGRQGRYLFTMALWIIALLNYFQPMEMYGALASGLLFFTGATVSFKSPDAHSNIVHYTSATTALVLSVIGLMVLHDLWLIPLSIIVMSGFSLVLTKKEHFIWWLEIITFLHIIAGYISIA